jgi:uncharacterized damage-inducible protein DinB
MKHILSFYRYNSEVREKYLDAIERLPWEEVVKKRDASFSSIRDIFIHVLNAYRYWFQFGIKDNLKEYSSADLGNFNNVNDLRRYNLEVDSMVMSLVESLQEEDLSRVYSIQTKKRRFRRTMESILMHMIEEELQHRGEINCMFWQQNIDPPVTSYDRWLEEKNPCLD